MISDFDFTIRHVLVAYLIPVLRWIVFYRIHNIKSTKLSAFCLILISFDAIFLTSLAAFGYKSFRISSPDFVDAVHSIILTFCLPSLVFLLQQRGNWGQGGMALT